MLMTQKFNSVNEIDKEFIPSLETLLSNNIPSFEFIRNYEENAPEDITFAYYLFFGNQTNAPIGFAQLELKNEKEIKQSLFKKILKKDPVQEQYEKSVKWNIPGSLTEGVVFEPRYLKHAKEATEKVFNELFEREDILSQELRYSQAYQELQNISEADTIIFNQSEVAESLIKNQPDYQSFIFSLPQETREDIKSAWKILQKELQLKMGDYQSFKESFAYKTEGAKQYKELKNNPVVKKYLNDDCEAHFLTLESTEKIEALIIFSFGAAGNGFYEIIFVNDHIPLEIPHQLAIIKFYESHNCERLHYTGDIAAVKFLKPLGFTVRGQYFLSANRPKQ